MRFIKFYLSLFWPKMPRNVVYMLQQVEYNPRQFLSWLSRLPNLVNVMNRKELKPTKKAILLVIITYLFWISIMVIGLAFTIFFMSNLKALTSVTVVFLSPIIAIFILLLTVQIARSIIITPRENKNIKKSKNIFQNHDAVKIAIAGSYGKTTMKEILNTVLSEKFKVAATEGNMNTPIAHARYASKLSGNEEILITEYGEGAPGDVERFAKTTRPEYAIITGLAPNHLEQYKKLETLADDIFSLRKYVKPENLFIAGESELLKPYIKPADKLFKVNGVEDWNINNIKITNERTSFMMNKKDVTISINGKLLGRHQIAPLALAVCIAYKLGLSKAQIEHGIEKIHPFPHRMYSIFIGGAQIIDDTYNGNLEGSLAGITLLSELQAKRKIYVTPGLVEQGDQKITTHIKIAKALFEARPDLIILMQNSATKIIKQYLDNNNYNGQIRVESNPLRFYNNLEHFVARGDLVVMQNDWTDNYN